MLKLIDEAVISTRSLTFELSPPILYELGLEAALEWLTEEMESKHGIHCRFEDSGQPKPLDHDIGVLLFQTVRELLVNVRKHARARNVEVSIKRSGANILIKVEDDGVGFDMKRLCPRGGKPDGFGLFSIRERMRHVGGQVEIKSAPGQGTRVTVTAPLRQG